MAYVKSDVGGALPLVASGKVRDLYEIDAKTLLFVATDRISAYDVIMKNGVPGKGYVLNLITYFWLKLLPEKVPGLKTHLISISELDDRIPQDALRRIKLRSMRVKRFKVFPVEAIVRGYMSGSAWSSYQKTGEVNGKKMPEGLRESQELPEPIYTPSTKAELGRHDENISTEEAAKLVGEKYAARIEELSLQIYKAAREYAKGKGIIIADTKFEFGLDEATDEVVLIDEVLTPDSSRFWSASKYQVGQSQDSFDKQYLRDWLRSRGLSDKEGTEMPEEVILGTQAKYVEAFQLLTGKSLKDTMEALR